jgi:mannitol/fructose-specific phosphotransferase system IIA component (Ntr-type)
MELAKYLSSELVRLNLISSVKDDVIRELSEVLCKAHGLSEPRSILDTLYLREQDRSTGIGNGVAIPHARTNLTTSIHLAMGRSKPGVEWGSMDGKPVHFVFLVVGPKNASTEYLHVLADISRLMSRAAMRNTLLETVSSEAVLKIISEGRSRETRT